MVTLLLSLAALGALLLLARRLATVSRCYPPLPPRHSVTGPVYLGGSVRVGNFSAPVREWAIECGVEIRGSSDRAIIDHLCGPATYREEGV